MLSVVVHRPLRIDIQRPERHLPTLQDGRVEGGFRNLGRVHLHPYSVRLSLLTCLCESSNVESGNRRQVRLKGSDMQWRGRGCEWCGPTTRGGVLGALKLICCIKQAIFCDQKLLNY